MLARRSILARSAQLARIQTAQPKMLKATIQKAEHLGSSIQDVTPSIQKMKDARNG